MESPFSLLVWWAGQASRKHWIMWDNSSSSMKNLFLFFLLLSRGNLFCSCSPSYCTLWFAPADFTIVLLLCHYWMLLYPRASPVSFSLVFFFGNSWILQRAESELSTLKRTISACELYTVLTPCLYSLDLFVRGKRRHFRKRDICATSNHVYVFLCFMGFFNF